VSQNNHTICRRQFVFAGSALLATTAVLPVCSKVDAAPADFLPLETPSKFKKSVKIGMVNVPGTLVDKFRVLKELGFDGVELDSPTGLTVAEVQDAIEKTGLPVHGVVDSIHWNKTLSHPDEAVRHEGLKGLETAILESKAFGGTSVLLVPAVCNKEVSYEDAWTRSIAEIKKAIPLAERLDIDILMENVWNNFLTSPTETARFIDELASPKIGAYYDVGNSVRYAPPAEWIKVLGKRIKKLDIKEYDLEVGKKGDWYAGFNVELLEGTCNWPVVMEELRKIGFTEGWGTAEIPGGDRTRLELIAKNIDKIFSL
jgi:L-ribulose-5-phosphate 3-epimerase